MITDVQSVINGVTERSIATEVGGTVTVRQENIMTQKPEREVGITMATMREMEERTTTSEMISITFTRKNR